MIKIDGIKIIVFDNAEMIWSRFIRHIPVIILIPTNPSP